MSEKSEHPLPEDLERVAARLRADRAQAEPLQLDWIKRTVMAHSSTKRHGSVSFMKSRLATAFSLVALLGGTGGAIAIGASGSSSSSQGGAASGQYKPGKGCGDRNHTHAKNGQCKLKHNCGRHGHQLCPSKPKHCYYYTAHNKRHSYECSAGEKANTGLRHGSKKGSKKSHVKAVNVKRSDPGSLTG